MIFIIKNTMTIGQIKSAIEKKLLESYTNNTFSNEIKIFKKLVLENKNIGKLFYLYDELNSKKGLNESVVDTYINECITLFENTINKINPDEFTPLKNWVRNTKTDNLYENIDNLFSYDVTKIDMKIQSRKLVSEQLKKQSDVSKEVINIPLSSSLNIANKVLSQHIEDLSESEKKELIGIITTSDNELKDKFNILKENTISKLLVLKESSDDETSSKIEDTIEKIRFESFDKLNYYRMKVLLESL